MHLITAWWIYCRLFFGMKRKLSSYQLSKWYKINSQFLILQKILKDRVWFCFSRNSGRPNRSSNPERLDNRMNYERSNTINHNRTSPRHQDNSQMSPAPYSNRNRGENSNHSHSSSVQQQGHNNLDTNNSSISSRQSDGLPPAQRWVHFGDVPSWVLSNILLRYSIYNERRLKNI